MITWRSSATAFAGVRHTRPVSLSSRIMSVSLWALTSPGVRRHENVVSFARAGLPHAGTAREELSRKSSGNLSTRDLAREGSCRAATLSRASTVDGLIAHQWLVCRIKGTRCGGWRAFACESTRCGFCRSKPFHESYTRLRHQPRPWGDSGKIPPKYQQRLACRADRASAHFITTDIRMFPFYRAGKQVLSISDVCLRLCAR